MSNIEGSYRPPKKEIPVSSQTVIGRERWSRREGRLSRMNQGTSKQVSSEPLLGEYLYAEWLPEIRLQVEPTTYSGLDYQVRAFIIPHLGSLPVSVISGETVRAFHKDLLRTPVRRGNGTLSKSTVIRIHATLSWALQRLVEAGRLSFNPAWSVKPRLTKSERYEPRTWSPGELLDFLKFVVNDDLQALWILLALTGIRRGEALALRWGDFSNEHRRVSVRRSLAKVDGAMYLTGTKGSRGRNIELTKETTDAIKRRKRRNEKRTQKASPMKNGPFVFSTIGGEPLDPSWVSKRFQKLVEEGGFSKIRLHDLRHTHATHLFQAGANVKAVQERLGHTDMVVTLETYVHVIPTIQAEAVKALRVLYRQTSK